MEKLKTFIPLNFALLSNPVNWVIVTLMVLLAGFALAHVLSTTATDQTKS